MRTEEVPIPDQLHPGSFQNEERSCASIHTIQYHGTYKKITQPVHRDH
jgi:hypothetical protein